MQKQSSTRGTLCRVPTRVAWGGDIYSSCTRWYVVVGHDRWFMPSRARDPGMLDTTSSGATGETSNTVSDNKYSMFQIRINKPRASGALSQSIAGALRPGERGAGESIEAGVRARGRGGARSADMSAERASYGMASHDSTLGTVRSARD